MIGSRIGVPTNRGLLDARYVNTTGDTMTGNLVMPAESFIGPSNTTGIYFKGGFVGIGTTGPGAKLHLYSSTYVSPYQDQLILENANSSDLGILLKPDSNGASQKFLRLFTGSNGANADFYIAQTTHAGANETTLFSVAGSSGNVSIPAGTLTVSGTGNSSIAGNVGIGTTGPKSVLHVSGSFGHLVVTKTTAYTAAAETVILCNATSAAFAITLPAATNSTDRVYHIKKTDSSANAVTIDGNASETIDGALTQSLSIQYESLQIVCDGSNWHIIGGYRNKKLYRR